MNGLPYSNKGVALITAILVVGIAATLATAMITRQQRDIRRTENTLRLEQAWLYMQGIDNWAIGVLNRDKNDNNTDSYLDDWNQPIRETTVAGGKLSAQISDMQGKFNINNLIGKKGINQMELTRLNRLLSSLQLPPELSDAIIDWIDPDSQVHYPNGAEDTTYNDKQPPYRTANVLMVDPTELRSVKGVTQAVYGALSPYIVALPDTMAINVNTAPKTVLMILADGLTESNAQAIIDSRTTEPFTTIQQFLEHPALAGLSIDESGLTTSSHYFQVDGSVQHGDLSLRFRSLIERGEEGSHVIQRMRREVLHEQ